MLSSKLTVLATAAFFVASCTSTPQTAPPSPTVQTTRGEAEGNLSKGEALLRASQVKDVHYKLTFDLTKEDQFSGSVKIQFTTLSASQDLRVDFSGGKLSNVKVDGRPLQPTINPDSFLVPRSELSVGVQQTIEADFQHSYSRSGKGLSRFKDPIDGAVYLHSQLEAYYANLMFPSFDQPDLKATFAVDVVAPADWTIVTSVRESSVKSLNPKEKLWRFPQSAKYSTYIFSLHAGPFKIWEDKSGPYPMRLMARQSLASKVKPEEWFPITKHGFEFFEKFFSTKYPYQKYDQLIVPEFSAGAMENVAAVTFSERNVTAGQKSKAQLRGLANVILHELAHMWFGNLVTMKWWGDLWLNESFATYMADRALAAHPNFPEAWDSFFNEKAWAYFEDRLPTTHPIVGEVKNTDEAFASFDGITYGKGAAVLKQLGFVIGEDNLKKALASYFAKFRERNTEFSDFMAELSNAYGKDLGDWQTQWFSTAGANVFTPELTCENGKITKLSVTQTFAENGSETYREHATQVALLTRSKPQGPLKVDFEKPVTFNGQKTELADFIGKPCPAVLALNYKDNGYFLSNWDVTTSKTLVGSNKEEISRLPEVHLRLQFWHAYLDQVRSAERDVVKFVEHTANALSFEKDALVLRSLVRSITIALELVQSSPALAQSKRAIKALESLERAAWMRFELSRPGSVDQLDWLDAISRVTTQPVGLAKAAELLRRPSTGRSAIDQDRRWNLVKLLAQYGHSAATEAIASEAKRDGSSKGIEQRIAAEASLPIWEKKSEWINQIKTKPRQYSFSQLRSAFSAMFPPHQIELEEKFKSQFIDELKWANANLDNTDSELFTRLFPRECDLGKESVLERVIQSADFQSLNVPLKKSLKEQIDQNRKCQKVVSKALSQNPQ